ncbi:MAG: hypothetical protein A2X49_09325 [Lentisphaerae bacterium GWF2_52_8]|nr:MAG: hypothetical protein A2X49_09325 [Lentisphaerae bacterium GWF2_52_8]
MNDIREKPWYIKIAEAAGIISFVFAFFHVFVMLSFPPAFLTFIIFIILGSVCFSICYLDKKIDEHSHAKDAQKMEIQELREQVAELKYGKAGVPRTIILSKESVIPQMTEGSKD